MLTEKNLQHYADVLLWALATAKKSALKKNDIILIQYDRPALRLAEILYDRLMDKGVHPVQRMAATFRMEKSFYHKAGPQQLTFLAPGDKELYRHIHGRIFLHAPESLTHLRDVDPAKIGKAMVARKPLKNILDGREELRKYSWTLCLLPTEELARQANMPLAQYARQVIRACYLDKKDPVSEWKAIHREVDHIKKALSSLAVKSFHLESDSMDLRITPGEQRKWAGVSGHNVPSFEVFVSPDWRGTEGVYYANLPSFRSGNYVKDVRISFARGKAVAVEAAQGEAFVKKQLAMDPGACRLGEFSLTDRRFSRIDRFMAETLFDENFGGKEGNCHVALGSSYSDTFSGNPSRLTPALRKNLGFNDSALHWDLVNTEPKTVTAHMTNGRKTVIYEGGEFKI
ncbi:MAG TPA: aminopeptidase [Smithellaceae bacterium]|nr:aminopeptidase [Smithella sp.]NMD22286.1 aminopeptidase [Verrucomicrobiota bacterium]HNV56701.1 aminopeptidase [Smithellaceae bacterium]HNY96356.1 aminopeptidase [Smithellaceae bacterium]HOD63620.1 aminopeptidase [Smithellaceae bacterium]